jgi:hypothetical protein
MAGVDLVTAMEMTGHTSLTIATRYQIVDLARQRAGIAKVEAHRAQQAPPAAVQGGEPGQ